MKSNKLTSGLGSIIFALFLLVPLTGAYAACCSGHGGVASCNKTTGFKVCKDGSTSPTCTCPKAKATKKVTTGKSKAIKTTTTVPKSTTTTTTPTNKTNSNWLWGTTKTKSTTTTTKGATTSTGGKSNKGCCSRHGGVSQCDTASGKLKCKDNTLSSTCTCH